MNRLTAILITLNEERNLPRALDSLAGLPDEILVVDAGSIDRTREIARQRGARVIEHVWKDYSDQRTFAAAQAAHDWVLAIDADEELSPELRASLLTWKQQPATHAAYEFPRCARYLGKWIRHSGWYPDRKTRLYDRRRARFVGPVHEAVQSDGSVARLRGDLFHYTHESLDVHRTKLEAYTTIAAEQSFQQGKRRWLLPALLLPPWTLLQKLVFRAGWLDGWRGILIAWMAARGVYLKFRKLGKLVKRRKRDLNDSAVR